ncbi:glycosyltransferase [Segetibacter sp. 3557_3]|uniref:glycosyltransferase n=1 Tax=Segetibacter sp. 3557_3 TaxID=2547429 RepID=UPI001058FF9B|nr:glycosyltransferase [Segetibacter sp. 3557_3]TDH24643.1 glycosyltransferase [Segetibacter sp. 3557_3]
MKILHLVPDLNPKQGGVGQAVITLVSGLAGSGIENVIVTLEDCKSVHNVNNSFTIIAQGPSKGPWKYSSTLLPYLYQQTGSFDVVVVHGLWLYHSYAIRKATRRLREKSQLGLLKSKKPKLFVMPHGMLDPYFQNAPGRKIKAVRNWFYWKLLERKLIQEADGLLFTCEIEQTLAKQTFRPYRPKNEIVVGLGTEAPPLFEISMNVAFLKRCPALVNKPYMLFISRIHEKKGVDLLIKAYDSCLRKHKNVPKLVIAGPGLETQYGKMIEELVLERKLQNQVFFTGMLSGEAKWGAFYGCDVFILPSHQENFGIAVAEALSCSKPVLISNQVNIWQEISQAQAGIIDINSLEGVKQLIETWLQMDKSMQLEMGARAKELYINNFSIDATIGKIIESFTLD